MENSLKGLMLAAGTIITCVVISLGFIIAREAKDTASNGTNQINMLNAEFAESDKTIYDGARVSGSEVLNAIRKFEDSSIGVLVKTKKANTYYVNKFNENTGELQGTSDRVYSDALDEKKTYYINPYDNFTGRVVRDANEVITGIVFQQ